MPRRTRTNPNSFIAYHGTNANFTRFDPKMATQGLIWFSSNRERIASGLAGARGQSRILKVRVTIKNPAGWNEYNRLSLPDLKRGYDGAILRDKNPENFDGFVFRGSQIKILGETP